MDGWKLTSRPPCLQERPQQRSETTPPPCPPPGHAHLPAQHVGHDVQRLQLHRHVFLLGDGAGEAARDLLTDAGGQSRACGDTGVSAPRADNGRGVASLPLEAGGSSPITVFRPMEEMSLSCSLSDSMLVHSVSTMVSTWYSFTLLTRGPRLRETSAPTVTHGNASQRELTPYHLTARFWTSPFLSSSNLRIILTTCQSKLQQPELKA